MSCPKPSVVDLARRWLCVLGLGLWVGVAIGATTDIANSPLFTSSTDVVKPNIMFILDDSGSMAYDYLPDTVSDFGSGSYAMKASQCNGLAYDPTITYQLPVTATGSSVAAGTLTTGTYYKYTGSQPKLSFKYIASTSSPGTYVPNRTTTFYTECNSAAGTLTSKFTSVSVATTSTEAQNYANWNAYYKTRIKMMKTALSLAFKSVDSRFRVGYSTTAEQTAAEDGLDFVDIRDFDATQKAKVYTAFNAANPSHWTPLRGSLSKAGQYYAKKARGQTVDPVQYSCQRNFTILSTDGEWNTPDESTTAPKFGPYQTDATTSVGQQDGSGTLRPMLDGNSVSTTTTESWTTTVATITAGATPGTTVSTSSQGTTTVTPITGYQRFVKTLPVTTRISDINRPSNSSPYKVVITTSSGHGFSTGDSVTVSGGSAAGYTGTFSITVLSSTTFSYPSATGSRPGNPSSTSTYTISPASAQSCSVGSGRVVQQEQRQDEVAKSTTTRTNTTTVLSTVTVTTTTSVITPYKRVIIDIGGVVASDTTTAGTLRTTATATTATATSPPVTTTSSITVPGANTFTGWVNYGAETFSGGCTSTLPNPSTTAAVAVGSPSTTATITATAPTSSGPTTTQGTATLSTGATTTSETAHVTTSSSVSTGGVSDSLADVAMYYYKTDLRSTALSNCTGALGSDVCKDNVKGATGDARHSFGDSASWQHMTTYTLGLGTNGLLTYDPGYLTQQSGDFFDILGGAKNWPASGSNKTMENVDDLWHAAVNGRGQYFNAGDPSSLATSLNSALNSIKAITGAASAASTSSLQPVEGDNDIYLAKFTTAKWVGDIEAYKIDPSTGSISTTTTWTASAQLDSLAESSRAIYYPNPSGASTLRAFTYANLTLDSYNGSFDNFCLKPGASGAAAPAQCSTLSAADKVSANLGANLVSYLRGNQVLDFYRSRDHVLGDIINASPLFVGKPSFKYSENGYATFAATARTPVILAAANDGMLHAFDRSTGVERWAYVPSFVMGNMYKLADTSYGNNHSFFVDGSPQMGDIFVGGSWKTIVVGGLNAGGRGYYALDVTNPVAPKLLWEFSATDLGLTFGNPVITKRSDGTWVVVFASGYNNVSSGDGNGHLYVLNANTGAQLLKIDTFTSGSTAAGNATTPSGLSKINAWIDSETNNTALRFYGGDLLGNVWRFDIDNLVAPNQQALRLAQLKLADGTLQSITVKPALGEITYNNLNYPVVYVPTGRYLGSSDLTAASATTQSMYAIKDPLTNTPYGDIRSTTSLVTQTITAAGSTALGTRTITANAVDWSAKSGWRVDFPASGERVNINPQLILNTLYVGTNLPNADTCTIGGSSFLYKFDISTGSIAAGDNTVATFTGDVLIQGITTVQLAGSGSSGSIVTILTKSDGTLETKTEATPSSSTNLHRTSWRELID